ncbi:hypothetical protein EG328_001498 [Venturia inaequalis]|uniref:Secreted protein n=1 Tax=Venturia inaequalis TaxID=5025 RepID=A0A8H3YYB6_VENIN|nr:hypothetical protein EG328_001498 [Venturia inaequalis]
MHLQTLLLPVILFTQSSIALYYCCGEATAIDGHRKFASYFKNGGIETWNPKGTCLIEWSKYGTDCSKWSARPIKNTCAGILKPGATIGVVAATECDQWGA